MVSAGMVRRVVLKTVALCALFAIASTAQAKKDLRYGTLLYEYYQQDYFAALVEYEYANELNEWLHDADAARLLKGGMTLSYGLPDEAQAIFKDLLDKDVSPETRNKAWYYLAKLYYNKGQASEAAKALARIKGTVPEDIVEEFNYLATLINMHFDHLENAERAINLKKSSNPYEPYLLFNLAVKQLQRGDDAKARSLLNEVVGYAKVNPKEEFAVLADRAKQALAHIHIQDQDLLGAWKYLQNVRTTGLYSNRALLSYGWTAIKLKRFEQAIPALKALNKRSISIAEVQEAKVLLAHLYEQKGATRAALKQYLLAEKAFASGVDAIDGARAIIAGQKIPEEFVINLEAIMDETDWYGSEPSLDYNKLTPFLIELMSSNPFHSVIKELRDLYALRENLLYWGRQAVEHQLIIKHRQQGLTSDKIARFIKKTEKQQEDLEFQISELRLHTYTLDVEEQERFTALLEATAQDFEFLEDRLKRVRAIEEPYRQSEENVRWAKKLHTRIKQKLSETDDLIDELERVMRIVVNAELDKHEERMRYYWAQARLGKARLYDQTLYRLEDIREQQSNTTGERP